MEVTLHYVQYIVYPLSFLFHFHNSKTIKLNWQMKQNWVNKIEWGQYSRDLSTTDIAQLWPVENRVVIRNWKIVWIFLPIPANLEVPSCRIHNVRGRLGRCKQNRPRQVLLLSFEHWLGTPCSSPVFYNILKGSINYLIIILLQEPP